jgi:hypothetical protein
MRPGLGKSDAWTHRIPKHFVRNDETRRRCFAIGLGVRARAHAAFSFYYTEAIPINSRCQGTSNAIARVGSAAIASSAPRDAMKDRSYPCCPADLSRRSRNSSARRRISVVGREPERRRITGHSDCGDCNAILAASRNVCRRRAEKCL